MNKLIIVSLVVLLGACTDTQVARFSSLGEAGEITCYSGGQVIFSAKSTGKILNAEKSDGYEFKDSVTGKLIRTNADCIVRN